MTDLKKIPECQKNRQSIDILPNKQKPDRDANRKMGKEHDLAIHREGK